MFSRKRQLATTGVVAILMSLLPATSAFSGPRAERGARATAVASELRPAATRASDVAVDSNPGVAARPKVAAELVKKLPLMAMLPNLTLELIRPQTATAPARLIVRNEGKVQAGAFFVANTLQISCEAGKLKSNVALDHPILPVNGLAAGNALEFTLAPAAGSGFGDMGCYWDLRATADAGGVIAETSESDNKDNAHFCSGSSCY